MTDYLALLKERVLEKRIPQAPSIPSEGSFEGFEGAWGRHVFEHERVKAATSGSVVDEWRNALSSLAGNVAPAAFSEARWQQLIDDGHAFLDQWGEQAARLGWTADDIFGVHPAAPAARFDAIGIVPLLAGRRVTAMSEHSAAIATSNGAPLIHRGRARAAVCLWDLTTEEAQ